MKLGRYRVKPRFFVMLALIVGALVFLVLKLSGVFSPPTVQWGNLDTDQAISAIVLRDETVVNAPQSGRFTVLAKEGSHVDEAQSIAVMYNSGYSEKYKQNLIDLQQNIKDWQENNILMDVIDSDLEALNAQINASLEKIRVAVQNGRSQELFSLESELRTLMTSRKDYMKSAITADDTLNKLYEQEASLEEKIAGTQTELKAAGSGLISFIFDNCEGLLSVYDISTYTPSVIEKIEKQIQSGKRPAASGGVAEQDKPMYRLVNESLWYALVVMNKKECNLTANAECYVTFDGLSAPVSARIANMTEEGSKTLVVLAMNEGVGSMVSLRQVNGHIGRSAEGYKVPLKAITTTAEGAWVTLKSSSGQTRVMVEILAQDGLFAIVKEVAGTGGVLVVGASIVMP